MQPEPASLRLYHKIQNTKLVRLFAERRLPNIYSTNHSKKTFIIFSGMRGRVAAQLLLFSEVLGGPNL